MTFLAAPRPRWFSIAAGRPFLQDLARGVAEAYRASREALGFPLLKNAPAERVA